VNVELLQKVKELILAEPNRLDMEDFQRTVDEYSAQRMRERGVKPPACGTTGCIAGWAVGLVDGVEALFDRRVNIEARAMDYLDLDYAQKERLFYFFPQYSQRGTPEYARAVADHIDRFIEEYA
jgi:hypothetical protein